MRRFASSALFALVVLATALPAHAGRVLEPKEFDRLDGHGPSAKKVDIIEWEGNLEIHVYPKGSLKSLAMKIDHDSKTSKNSVMVIEYGFVNVPYTLIRRAVLSIPMPDKFFAFRAESDPDYDKIIVSGHQIADAKPYALAPPPTQLYPDYHPALAQDDDVGAAGEPAKSYQRKSASEGPAPAARAPRIQLRKAEEFEQDSRGTMRRRTPAPSNTDDEGGIRNFAF